MKEDITNLKECVTKLSDLSSPKTSYVSVVRSANAPPSTQPSSQASPMNSSSIQSFSSAFRQTQDHAPNIVIDLTNLKE